MNAWRPSRARTARSLAAGLLAVGGAALVVFHAALLWRRLLDGSLLDPMVAGRWAATLLLAGWLVALRRARVSLWRGDRARAFWVLVLLLHAVPALAGGTEGIARHGQGLLLVLPGAVATSLLVACLPLVGARATAASLRPLAGRLGELAVPVLAAGLERSLAARAPPA